MSIEELRESLLFAPKNGYTKLTAQQRQEMEDYCKRYAAFMDDCKTEREATAWTVRAAEERGFRPVKPGMTLTAGDKVYMNNRDKSILLAVIGKEPLSEGANICAAHIDSPRMDLKPNPLYEDSEIAYFKTHYYGGIKKYQWTTVPLAIHGVVCKADGSQVTVTILDDKGKPVTMEDIDNWMAEDNGMGLLAPYKTDTVVGRHGGNYNSVSVYGTTPAYYEIQSMQLFMGRWLKSADVSNNSYVCVINKTAATELIGYEDCVGQTIVLDNVEFTVVGVLEDDDDSLTSILTSGTLFAYIPYTTPIR